MLKLPDLSDEESALVSALAKVSKEKQFYGTEKELMKRLAQ